MASVEQLRAIQTDEEFENVCPPLTDDEVKQLEANILSDGEVTSPLIVWNGILVDGHNRRRILLKHPELPFAIREMKFANRFDAVAWICRNQLGRRNITENMKAYLIGMQYKAEKQSHGASDGFRGNRYTSPVSDRSDHLLKTDPPKTRERVAKDNGVSEGYVQRAELFTQGVNDAEEAVPGVKEAILSGEIKASKKEVAAIAKAPAGERKQLVEDLMKPPKERKRSVREKTVGIDFEYLPDSDDDEEISTVNYESIIGIIHGAAERMQGTCDNYFTEHPELLERMRPQICEALFDLKHFIDDIFEGGSK